MNGILNIYKERGYTSHDVVAKLRGICRQKKIGHTGTLDPDAQGVLPVCLGSATRVCDMLTDKTKEYETVLLFGIVTDTQDISGTVLKRNEVSLSAGDVTSVIKDFTGDIEQIPPMYSAIKVGGKKLYELAREGKEIERKPRPVTIHSIDIISIDLPRVRLHVTCSKGTYIRTLCHDIGAKLGCGAAMESLIRTRSGDFTADSAVKLSTVQEWADEGSLEEHLIPVEKLFEDCGSIVMSEGADKLLMNGNPFKKSDAAAVKVSDVKSLRFRVYGSNGDFAALYDLDPSSGLYKVFKMFIS
ncbi:MAG: tRNA pseudouridine(55) synthase TruB [Lachnospiraceae bacterium]|nr:tRNA pseudouridine(55) synthase TruB [Lachnospiraceae bacterium]